MGKVIKSSTYGSIFIQDQTPSITPFKRNYDVLGVKNANKSMLKGLLK